VGEDICTVVDRIENDSAGAAAADDAVSHRCLRMAALQIELRLLRVSGHSDSVSAKRSKAFFPKINADT